MCGIVGQARRRGAVDPSLIERMSMAIEHRGPDSRGAWVDGPVGLGIQRLRVIDLQTGDQPIFNEDRSVVVVLNGEIYNYRQLRHELLGRGHRFSTQSDTEVLVHLYEERGLDCVDAVQGMFAFALWDASEERLVLARDRVGKKPLFYALRDGTLSFASELQGLLQNAEIPRDLDHQALDCYYAYQYVPSPMTAFRAIRKLPPATIMTFQDGEVRQRRYWRLSYQPKEPVGDLEELRERIRVAVTNAVRKRMISDVPLGALLSGGIDSSAVVAAMARNSSIPIKTFSIGFTEEPFNELPYARTVARQYATDHRELVVEPSAIAMLPKMVRHYGEPFADSSALPSFYLAEFARKHVTVALNGDGGDESFGGYHRYVANTLGPGPARLPPGLRRAAARCAAMMPANSSPQSLAGRIRRRGHSMLLTPAERYAASVSYFDRDEREELYTSEYKHLIGQSLAPGIIDGPWSAATGDSIVDAMLETDVETYLPGDLLVKMDIATMAYSLEARSPLLDPEVMQLAASLPSELKVRGQEKKVVLRDALRPWVPGEVLDRPKMGFGVPINRWFRNELKGYVADVLLDPKTLSRGYFRREYVARMLRQHAQGRRDNSYRMWSLLVAELWHREFIDSPPPPVMSVESSASDRPTVQPPA